MQQYPQEYYSRYEHYLRKRRLSDVTLFARILELAKEQRPQAVLDIGCGVGYLISAIADETNSIAVGVDFSAAAVGIAAARFKNPGFLRANSLSLPFQGESFDVALAINIVEHLTERDQMTLLSEAHRVLRPNGLFVCSTPDPSSFFARVAIHDKTHVRELSAEEFIGFVGTFFSVEEAVLTNSIGRFGPGLNRALSTMFPADVLVSSRKKTSPRSDYFSKYSFNYPLAHALARACEADALSQAVIRGPTLDLGCGDGSFMKILRDGQPIDVGADLDVEGLKRAGKANIYRSCIVCLAEALPFENGTFASVVSNSVFEHLGDHSNALNQINRILQPDGSMLITIPNPRTEDWWLPISFWRSAKRRIWGHKSIRTDREWRENLRRSGFSVQLIQEFANRNVIRALDLLFLPSAIWFLLARNGIRLPLLGSLPIFRGLVRRFLWSLYWRNRRGEGASFMIEARKLEVKPTYKVAQSRVQHHMLAHAVHKA